MWEVRRETDGQGVGVRMDERMSCKDPLCRVPVTMSTAGVRGEGEWAYILRDGSKGLN